MNKKSTNKKNGMMSSNIEAIREQVIIDELKARHWKAQYETAYYHMEFDKLLPAYSEFLDKLQKEREEADKKQREYFEELQKISETDLKGEVKIEEVADDDSIKTNLPEVQLGGTLLVDTKIAE